MQGQNVTFLIKNGSKLNVFLLKMDQYLNPESSVRFREWIKTGVVILNKKWIKTECFHIKSGSVF